MHSLSWVGLKTPDIFRYVFTAHWRPPGSQLPDTTSAVGDGLTAEVESAVEVWRKAEPICRLRCPVLDNSHSVGMWYENNVLVTGSGIVGYRSAADANYDGLLSIRSEGDL